MSKANTGGSKASAAGPGRQRDWIADAWRRILDAGVASMGLVISAPVLGLAAAAILLEDGRPVFYRRRVLARGGKEFDAFKLRTMRSGSEVLMAEDSALAREYSQALKLKRDPRVTRVGAWLRRYSIDEVPQLVNVMRGQMTLVGPRMVWPGELHRFGDLGPRILSVKPGLTGLWQVSGRQDLSFEERLRLDQQYLERRSVWFDLKILLRTLPAVASAKGAY